MARRYWRFFRDRLLEMAVDLRSRKGNASDIPGIKLIEEIAVANSGWSAADFADTEDD